MQRIALWVVMLMMFGNAVAITETDRQLELAEIASETELAMQLARAGQYGKLSKFSRERATEAARAIANIAKRSSSLADLSAADREVLDNARAQLDEHLRIRNKNRIVCTKEAPIGSRLPRELCLTVGQREDRARNARRATRDLQRNAKPIENQ